MNEYAAISWHEANQRYLMNAVKVIRHRLESQAVESVGISFDEAKETEIGVEMTPPPALESLCAAFGLSDFERSILLMCTAMELDGTFPALITSAQKDPRRAFPTFGLALAALKDAHWSALSPPGPLRRWRLIDVEAGETLTSSPLRIDERVLHYLTGVSHLDERLRGLLEVVRPPTDLLDSRRTQAELISGTWSSYANGAYPIIQLCGEDAQAIRSVAASACARLDLTLHAVAAQSVPHHPAELDAFIRLWQREAVLSNVALLIDYGDSDSIEAIRENAIRQVLEQISGFLMVSTRVARPELQRAMVTLDIAKPTAEERHEIWRAALGDAGMELNGSLERLGAHFDISALAIRSACSEALQAANQGRDLQNSLWNACRKHARPKIDQLAQRITPMATWQDLVLPDAQKRILHEVAIHVRQRAKVYESWGFASTSSRGLGISALFSGPSGTGKTFAGEVLANELKLDLYRIDLSQVVNKYIGETEKNLRRVFDAADVGGVILLFDEADALFGKRTETKDSHDRFANIEISYLLQRMEEYRGLAILTTNMKSALDHAFLRRLRFVVEFPFPDAIQRAEIWRRIFPAATPKEALDYDQLARLQVSGGNIRNISMHAAFLAAEADEPIRMTHLRQAARSECTKIERPMTSSEMRGWQ